MSTGTLTLESGMISTCLLGFYFRPGFSKARLEDRINPDEAVERMIRVDHAGEYGAIRIYEGQLAMLRRLSGYKMKGENYSRADIEAGRVGIDQVPPDPKVEFD